MSWIPNSVKNKCRPVNKCQHINISLIIILPSRAEVSLLFFNKNNFLKKQTCWGTFRKCILPNNRKFKNLLSHLKCNTNFGKTVFCYTNFAKNFFKRKKRKKFWFSSEAKKWLLQIRNQCWGSLTIFDLQPLRDQNIFPITQPVTSSVRRYYRTLLKNLKIILRCLVSKMMPPIKTTNFRFFANHNFLKRQSIILKAPQICDKTAGSSYLCSYTYGVRYTYCAHPKCKHISISLIILPSGADVSLRRSSSPRRPSSRGPGLTSILLTSTPGSPLIQGWKKPVFFLQKTQPSGFFRVFRVFSVSRILLGASRS